MKLLSNDFVCRLHLKNTQTIRKNKTYDLFHKLSLIFEFACAILRITNQ